MADITTKTENYYPENNFKRESEKMIRTGIKVELDVGDVVSNAGRARSAIASIDEAMKKAQSEKRFDDYGRLAYEKDRLQSRAAGFDRNVRTLANTPKMQGTGANGQPVFKMDSEYASLIKSQIDTEKKLIASFEAAVKKGDVDEAMSVSSQLEKLQKEFNKTVGEATGTGKAQSKTDDALKSMFAQQMVNAINSGLQLWVSSADRTGIINSLGNGDIMGAQLAERQRRSNIWSGGLEITGAVAQGVGMAFGPVGIGIGTGVNLLTKLASSYVQKNQKEEANKVAYAGLWEGQKDQSLNLAAMLGDPSRVRKSWEEAARMAAEFGYTAEEGMEALKQAASQGLDGRTVSHVFDYERRTGADRGTLSSLANMSARYVGEDVLQAAWRGLSASGMKTGQYNEFLRGMERVMSDGIQKGFIRSSEQVSRNLTMLSRMTNDNPLWKGELGAQRLMKMNSGLEGTVGLQSSSDIIAFRAAKRVLEKAGESTAYEDVLALQERGISDSTRIGNTGKTYGTELLREIMSIASEVENGDRAGMIEIMRDIFRFNYNEASTFQRSWNPNMSDTELNAAIASSEIPLPSAGKEIDELRANIETMNVRNLTIEAGQKFWDSGIWEAIIAQRKEYHKTTTGDPIPPGNRKRNVIIGKTSEAVFNSYFGHGGDAKEDDKALKQMRKMRDFVLQSDDDSQLNAAYAAFDKLNRMPAENKRQWDDKDMLNSVANSSDAVQFLAALNRLILLTERNNELTERNADINITWNE
jgi:hypothetical protein